MCFSRTFQPSWPDAHLPSASSGCGGRPRDGPVARSALIPLFFDNSQWDRGYRLNLTPEFREDQYAGPVDPRSGGFHGTYCSCGGSWIVPHWPRSLARRHGLPLVRDISADLELRFIVGPGLQKRGIDIPLLTSLSSFVADADWTQFIAGQPSLMPPISAVITAGLTAGEAIIPESRLLKLPAAAVAAPGPGGSHIGLGASGSVGPAAAGLTAVV